MNVQARGVLKFFCRIHRQLHLMQRNFKTFGKFKKFLVKVEKQLGKTMKTLQSYQGDQYLDDEFKVF